MFSNKFWNAVSEGIGKKIGNNEFSRGALGSDIRQDISADETVIQNKPTSLRFGEDNSIDDNGGRVHLRDSTAINSVTYDPKTEEMAVSFTSKPNKEYDFINVSPSLFKRYMRSGSKGRFTAKELLRNPAIHKPGPWDN